MYNVTKLHKELEAEGIVISGCNIDGIVWDANGNEIQDAPEVQAVLAIHDPTPVLQAFIEFDLPVKAPDFVVASPKPKDNPKDALARALQIANQPHGTGKSIAEMVLNFMVVIDDLAVQVDDLKKRVK